MMSNFLEHKESKKHKYIARIKVKQKWRYFYDKAELDAYFNGQRDKSKQITGNDSAKSLGRTNSLLKAGMSAVANVLSKAKNTLMRTVNESANKIQAGAKAATKFMKDVASKVFSKNKNQNKQAKNEAKNAQKENATPTPQRSSDTPDETKEPRDHKYIARIKMPNGKYRYFYDTKSLENYYNSHPEAKPKDFDRFKLKDHPSSPEEDMAEVNPNYDPYDDDTGYENNCYACTLTYEARRRGYDVEARWDTNGEDLYTISDMYRTSDGKRVDNQWVSNSGTPDPKTNARDFETYIKDAYGEGSRGQLCVYWAGGGGHSIVWEVENNEVLVRDCQLNKTYQLEDVFQYVDCSIPGTINVLRTDDKEFSDTANRYMRNDQTKEG